MAHTRAPARRSIHSERLNVTSAIIEEERVRNGEAKKRPKFDGQRGLSGTTRDINSFQN